MKKVIIDKKNVDYLSSNVCCVFAYIDNDYIVIRGFNHSGCEPFAIEINGVPTQPTQPLMIPGNNTANYSSYTNTFLPALQNGSNESEQHSAQQQRRESRRNQRGRGNNDRSNRNNDVQYDVSLD